MTTSQQITVTVLIETFDGKASEEMQAFQDLVSKVLAEKGCIQYELTQSIHDENQFVLLEKWESMTDLEAHLQTPHMVKAIAQAKAFRSKPPQIIITKTV